MPKLKPCPFCGEPAEMNAIGGRHKFCRSKMDIPEDATEIKREENQYGAMVYTFRAAEFIPRCVRASCCGRSYKRFQSREAAEKAWNRRAYNGTEKES